MTLWRCPSCPTELEARAVAVGHRCPNRHNRWVDFIAEESIPARVSESETSGTIPNRNKEQ